MTSIDAPDTRASRAVGEVRALEIAHLSKTFPATRALSDVALTLERGEVHALVGTNGSGKSTLIKILAGYHDADEGALAEIGGVPFALSRQVPSSLRFVHQDLGLILELNAIDNLALHGGFAKGLAGRVRWREQRQVAREILARFDVELDLDRPLAEATPVERTVVAIAAAVEGWKGGTGVLVLDEPSALLPHTEVDRLHAMIAEVRRSGAAVLYVSHRLDEIFRIADTVTVLRAGHVVASQPVSELDERSLARLMVGEDVDPAFRADVAHDESAPVVLELRGVRGRWLDGLDLNVHRGEVLGIAGLAGSGREELPTILAGVDRGNTVSGAVRLPFRSAEWTEVTSATQLNIPLVPAERVRDAIVGEFNVRENMSIGILDRLSPRGLLSRSAERTAVKRWIDRFGIVGAGGEAPIGSLSGGNQQKVVIARCLLRDSDVLVLSEPTAGVDIHTRIAIYEAIAAFAKDGLTVVVASTDTGDLRAMCSRIVVLRNGHIRTVLPGDSVTDHELTTAMEGPA